MKFDTAYIYTGTSTVWERLLAHPIGYIGHASVGLILALVPVYFGLFHIVLYAAV